MTNLKDYSIYSILLKSIIISLFLCIFSSASISAQTELDTTVTVQSADTSFVMTKSPWRAVLRSAIIPGWGQFYNEDYWKIPVVWGFLGYFGYIWNDQHQLYWEYRTKFKESLVDNPETGDSKLKGLREFYRNQRDEFAVYIALTYFLNLIDAYVGAHLFDFDVSINDYTRTPQLNMRLKLD